MEKANENAKATVTEKAYSVKIIFCSDDELSVKDRIVLKEMSDNIKLDDVVTSDKSINIKPIRYAVLKVHNENSENKDYEVVVIECEDGFKYQTSSTSFKDKFEDLFSDLKGIEEEWAIKVLKKDSTNYKGKQFLTCTVV